MKKLISLFLFFSLCNPLYGLETPVTASPEKSLQKHPGHSGVVLSSMQVGSYTYVELDEGDKVIWIAGQKTSLKKGDKITTSRGAEMHDFFSKFLNRNFPVIFFVEQINVEGAPEPPALKEDEAPKEEVKIKTAKSAPAPLEGEVASAEGVYSLATVLGQRGEFQDKRIKVRGKIVKSTGFILGKHWYHIQDGTDMGPHNADLVITTDKEVEAGDIVEAFGIIKLNRDFGSGYKYPIILENAEVTILKQNKESSPQL